MTRRGRDTVKGGGSAWGRKGGGMRDRKRTLGCRIGRLTTGDPWGGEGDIEYVGPGGPNPPAL